MGKKLKIGRSRRPTAHAHAMPSPARKTTISIIHQPRAWAYFRSQFFRVATFTRGEFPRAECRSFPVYALFISRRSPRCFPAPADTGRVVSARRSCSKLGLVAFRPFAFTDSVIEVRPRVFLSLLAMKNLQSHLTRNPHAPNSQSAITVTPPTANKIQHSPP
jgi:hypothetical protein